MPDGFPRNFWDDDYACRPLEAISWYLFTNKFSKSQFPRKCEWDYAQADEIKNIF